MPDDAELGLGLMVLAGLHIVVGRIVADHIVVGRIVVDRIVVGHTVVDHIVVGHIVVDHIVVDHTVAAAEDIDQLLEQVVEVESHAVEHIRAAFQEVNSRVQTLGDTAAAELELGIQPHALVELA